MNVYPDGSHALFHGPRCYLVFGDALCGFNPRYDQGMSVAALESLALDECRAAGAEDLWRRFFARSREVVDTPWRISTGSDLTHPGVAYPRPAPARFICAGWLADKLGRKPAIVGCAAVSRVWSMREPTRRVRIRRATEGAFGAPCRERRIRSVSNSLRPRFGRCVPAA